MRFLALASLALVWASASAQYVPFRPLAVGDTWTYAIRRVETFASSSCTLPAEPSEYVRADVLQETTFEGQPSRVIGCTQLAPGGAILSTGRVVIPLQFSYASSVLSGVAGFCQSVFSGSAPTVTTGPAPVDIGGQTYTMNATARTTRIEGACSHQINQVESFGDLVGKLSDVYGRTRGCSASPLCSRQSLELVSAVVGGTMYGRNVVASEGAPAGAAVLALRVYPVPAGRSVTVEADEAAAVDVVDALGRVVASGEAAPGRPLRLDVSAWPAGVYVARSVGTSGPRASRLVVAR